MSEGFSELFELHLGGQRRLFQQTTGLRQNEMIVETIAAGAIAVLGPYFAEAGKGFAKKAGESLAEKAGSLYGIVKAKFAGDSDAQQALAVFESKPESPGRVLALKEVLTEKLNGDADFAEVVNKLVEEAKRSDSRNVIVFGDRNIATSGDVTESTFITGDNNVVSKS